MDKAALTVALCVVGLPLVLAVEQQPPRRAPQADPLSAWQVAIPLLQEPAELIAQDKLAEARVALARLVVELPAPYADKARRVSKAILAAGDAKVTPDYYHFGSLGDLCAELKASGPAMRCYWRAVRASPADPAGHGVKLSRLLLETDAGESEFHKLEKLLVSDDAKAKCRRNLFDARLARRARANVSRLGLETINDAPHVFGHELINAYYALSFDRLMELHRLLPRLTAAELRAAVYERTIDFLKDDEPGRRAWEDKLVAELPKTGQGDRLLLQRAQPRLHEAETACNRGQWEKALALYRGVARDYPGGGAFAMAQFNIGIILEKQLKHDEAVREYAKIFPSNANDQDPGGHLMEAYRNYRNNAAKAISRCLEFQGDAKGAYEWTVRARDEYPHSSWCGTCADSEARASARNILRLAFKAGKIDEGAALVEKYLLAKRYFLEDGAYLGDANSVELTKEQLVHLVMHYDRQGKLDELERKIKMAAANTPRHSEVPDGKNVSGYTWEMKATLEMIAKRRRGVPLSSSRSDVGSFWAVGSASARDVDGAMILHPAPQETIPMWIASVASYEESVAEMLAPLPREETLTPATIVDGAGQQATRSVEEALGRLLALWLGSLAALALITLAMRSGKRRHMRGV